MNGIRPVSRPPILALPSAQPVLVERTGMPLTTTRATSAAGGEGAAAAAGGVEESIGTGDRLSSLDQGLLVACVTQFVDIRSLARFSQTSRKGDDTFTNLLTSARWYKRCGFQQLRRYQ